MNNDMNMVELNDEQLDTVAGGYGYNGFGLNIDVNVNTPVNVATTVPVIVAPTIAANVFSPGSTTTGSSNGILAGALQKNN